MGGQAPLSDHDHIYFPWNPDVQTLALLVGFSMDPRVAILHLQLLRGFAGEVVANNSIVYVKE